MRIEITVVPDRYQIVYNTVGDNLTFDCIGNLVEENEGIPSQYIQFRDPKNHNIPFCATENVEKYVINNELKIAMMYTSLSGSCSCLFAKKRG